jgi:hypothetical protein
MRRTVRPLLIAAALLSVVAASCVGAEPAIPSDEPEGGAVAEGGGTADVTVHDAASEVPGVDSAAGDDGGQDTGVGADGGPDATVEAGPEAGADALPTDSAAPVEGGSDATGDAPGDAPRDAPGDAPGDAPDADGGGTTEAGAGVFLGAQSFGGLNNDQAAGVVFDSSGNAYVTGDIEQPTALVGNVTLTAAGETPFLAKLDPNGNVLWAVAPTLSTGTFAVAKGIAIKANGHVVVGVSFEQTIVWGSTTFTAVGAFNAALFEFDANGNVVGGARYGGSTGSVNTWSVAALPDGGLAMAGNFSGTTIIGSTTLTGNGDTDCLLLIVDSSYNVVYAAGWGGPLVDQNYSVIADSANNVYVTGEFNGSPTVAGTQITSAGGEDIYLASFTSTGTLRYVKSYGSAGNDSGWGINLLPGGDVVFAGTLGGPVDFGGGPIGAASTAEAFVARFTSATPTYVWAEPFGATGQGAWINAYTLGVGPSGHIAVPMYFSGVVNFGVGPVASIGGSDALLLDLDANGNALWNAHLGGPSSDQGLASAVDANGNVVWGGFFQASATIATTTLTSAGMNDGFIARSGP